MVCLTHMGRKVKMNSPPGSPQQGDQKSTDEADYQEAMKQFKGGPAATGGAKPLPDVGPTPSQSTEGDDVSSQIWKGKAPKAGRGGYLK